MARIAKDQFEKALIALEEAHAECLLQEKDSKAFKLFRDATIQRFEFCVELAWKVSAKTLGSPASSPKPALREMFKSGLISDINAWFDFIEARNKSSHTYEESVAVEVFSCVRGFVDAARALLSKI